MQPYILSDEAVYAIKSTLQNKMLKGLEDAEDSLLMEMTFVMDRYKGTERGNFVSICAHSQHFTITLVKLTPGTSPEILKKQYFVDPDIFKKPHIKIYNTFAKYVKKFFVENHLDGEVVSASFCTNLDMEQYSLDTAVIPYFNLDSKTHKSQKDIKAYFEHVLQKEEYQGETNSIKSSKSHEASNTNEISDTDRTYHATYDAKLLGTKNVKHLGLTIDFCHNLLDQFQVFAVETSTRESSQRIMLDVSHAGVKVYDKVFKNFLQHHPIHKISHVVQDFKDAHIFGYVYGDFLEGHQFHGFKTDKNSTEIVSLLRNIFTVELIRKKKEKLQMQVSQVFMTLKDFLALAHEMKSSEVKIPQLLRKRINTVENINCWLESSFGEYETVPEKSKELPLIVKLQELYASACHLKKIEIQKEEAARLEKAKLSKKHIRTKKKGMDKCDKKNLEVKEVSDPMLVKVTEIFSDSIKFLENILKSHGAQLNLIEKNLEKLNTSSEHGNLNNVKKFCFFIFNNWNQENKSLMEEIECMISAEKSEREKIKYKMPSISTGKKQSLKITKQLIKPAVFEDTDFMVPRQDERMECGLLDELLSCEKYFFNALKMRREEVEDLNYFISCFHFREGITTPEDSTAVDNCRRFFIKAIKMRLNEVEDIERKLKQLKNAKEKIIFMIPDAIEFVVDLFSRHLSKRKSSLKVVEDILPDLSESFMTSEENIHTLSCFLTEFKMLIKKDIIDTNRRISELQMKESSFKNIAKICFRLYNETIKLRRNEFDETISDLDLFVGIAADSNADEDMELLHFCQEEYLTFACMREKEIEALEFQIRIADKDFKSQVSIVPVTLKELFCAAIEMEKCECEKILKLDKNIEATNDVLPVVYSFKELFEVVVQYLKNKNSSATPSLKDPQIYTSLREFLTAAFKLKQREVEIPIPVLKADLESVLIELIEMVKQRYRQKQLQSEIHEQALKISRSWKEVFLLSLGIREKEVQEVISSKRKEVKETAAFNSLKGNFECIDNEVNQVVKNWWEIFSDAIEMKNLEIEQVNLMLKMSPKDQKDFIPESQMESPLLEDDDDERYSEVDHTETQNKQESPLEEILKAIGSCKHIYNIAINKGYAQLEEMEYEIRPIFSVEYDEEKEDLLEDDIATAVISASDAISNLIDDNKVDISTMKAYLESLSQIEENIKSQVSSAKSACLHYLTLLLELEEKAFRIIEMKIQFFRKLLPESYEDFRPFTDLIVDELSEEELVLTDTEESQKKDESELKESPTAYKKLTKEEIQSVLFEVESELHIENDKNQLQQRQEVVDIFVSCMEHFELSSEMRKRAIDLLNIEIESLKMPDEKKMKAKEKVQKALQHVIACKEFLLSSINLRQLEMKVMLANNERMKDTQKKEELEYQVKSSEIIRNCRRLFLSAIESRRKNIVMMKNEIENLDIKKGNMSEIFTSDAKSLLKSEIYSTCKDLVLESVDLKLKEINDILSQVESLQNIERKVEIQLKQLIPEKHMAAWKNLGKVKDAVATCKKLCNSAAEKDKKEVKETDEELELLKNVLQASETSLISSTCKSLLMSAIDKKEAEISLLECGLHKILENIQDLFIQFDDLILNENPTVTDGNFPDNLDKGKELSELEQHHLDVDIEKEKPKVVSNETSDIEQICKMKINLINDFLKECKETLQIEILRKKEEIASLEVDLEKIRVTVQKVENEDNHVFSICRAIYLPIVEMRDEEMKSFDTELKILQRLFKCRAEDPLVSQKAENPEESEVFLAIVSCKRILNLAIKNRKREKDDLDFQLMKLVRFQDSRIANMCEQFLLTTLQRTSEEMGIIKTKLLKIESLSTENEIELLEVSLESLKNLRQATELQRGTFISEMQLFIKKKMQLEIEESQFVLACKSHLSSQVDVRMEEITLLNQELDTLSESQSYNEGFDTKVLNLKSVYEKVYEDAISTRKREIEKFHCELVKHNDIEVSEEISICEKLLQTYIQELNNELQIYDLEAERVSDLENAEIEEVLMTLHRLHNIYSTNLKKRKKNDKVIEEILQTLQGNKTNVNKKVIFDIRTALKQDASFKKLKTDASIIINVCKEILYSVIEVFRTETETISITTEKLKRQRKDEEIVKKEEAFSFQDENSRFTTKELALLEALEQDIFKSKSTKREKVTEFCDEFFIKLEKSHEAFIQSAKQFLVKLSDIEEELLSEASKLIYFMINLIKSVHDKKVKEKNFMLNDLQILEDLKNEEKYEFIEMSKIFKEILVSSAVSERNVFAILKLSLDSLKRKENELKFEISKVYRNCGDFLLEVVKMIEVNMKHLLNDLENLKVFGCSDENEEESKLSEDEKVIQRCKLFLLTAIDQRKKLIHSVNLELKFLKGRIGDTRRNEESKVFPSWHDRFLTFVGLENDSSISEAMEFSPSVLDSNLTKTQAIPSGDMKRKKLEVDNEKLENIKNLLKSLEQKWKDQPIYTISSWEELLFRSILIDEIGKSSIDQDGRQSYNILCDVIKEKSWEELFYEAENMSRKQMELAIKLKEKEQLFVPLSFWSEVLCEAVNDWIVIMKEESLHLKNENLLLEWRGKIKSKENLEYIRGSKWNYRPPKFHTLADNFKKTEKLKDLPANSVNLKVDSKRGVSSLSVDTDYNQISLDSEAVNGKDISESFSSWNGIFSKSVVLMEDSRKAFNFIRKKSTKLQSQVINVFSTWDELISKAIEQRKMDFQEELNENNALKGLAKTIKDEVKEKSKKQETMTQDDKFESWLQLIYDASQMHGSELMTALHIKKSEMEKSSKKYTKRELESPNYFFLTLESQEILRQGKKLLTEALEIRKKEIIKMERELKCLEDLTENRRCNLKEIPQPILIWKLIISVALTFKASGQKFEPETKKSYTNSSKELFVAAMQSKMKEMENFESYWKKFTRKQYFLEMISPNVPWSKILNSISELTKKEITRMSVFGLKTEPDKEETVEVDIKAEDNLDLNQDGLENSACWTDLILAAVEQESCENKPCYFEDTLSQNPLKEDLISWDEIFFFMNQMCKDAIKERIFDTKVIFDYFQLKDIRHMVASSFFTWDVLIIGVIEEILWVIQDMPENITETFDADTRLNHLSFINAENFTLKYILEQLRIQSFEDILPNTAGSEKLKIEDILNQTIKRIRSHSDIQTKKFLDESILWKCLFPIAVKVWQRKRSNKQNFQYSDSQENCTQENSYFKALYSESVGDKSYLDSEYQKINLNSLKELEKVIAYDYISDIEGNIKEKLSNLNEEKEQIKLPCSEFPEAIVNDLKKKFESAENTDPEYFCISVSWRELFKAALERHKSTLIEVLDLHEDENECLEMFPNTSTSKNLKFNASNVLNQEIRLEDLFEIVDSLKKKNLVILQECQRKDTVVNEDSSIISLENLKVSEVIEMLAKIFRKSLKYRFWEKNLVGQKIEKLLKVSLSDCENFRVYPVIANLKQYFSGAIKSRSEENELIISKLESLNEFKDIFSGYLECPITESLLKRNVRLMKEMNALLHDLRRQEAALIQNLKSYLNSIMSVFENSLKRRKTKLQLGNLEHIKELGNNLELINEEIFFNSKKLLSSVLSLRNEEIHHLQQYILDLQKMYKYDESVENSMHIIISSALNYFGDKISEREAVTNLMLQEKRYLQERKTDLSSKVSLMFTNYKSFLFTAIDNRKKEICTINEQLNSLKTQVNQLNKKTSEVITLCEEFCHKFVEKRESEIKTLEEYITQLNEIEISQVQSLCLEYSLQAIASRKIELATIDDYIETFQTFCESIEREVLRKYSEFYAEKKEDIKFEIKTLEMNSEVLNVFEGNIALHCTQIINFVDKFEELLENELNVIKEDLDQIHSELNFIKSYQNTFYLEIFRCLINCRKHFEEILSEIERDIYILQLQLAILSSEHGNAFDEDISILPSGEKSDYPNFTMQEVNKIDVSLNNSKDDVAVVYSDESTVARNTYEILNSALDLRLSQIDMLSKEIISLSSTEKEVFQTLSSSTDDILNMIEKRNIEKKWIENTLFSFESVCETEIISSCIECLSCLLQYNVECVSASVPDLDKLNSIVLNMKKKKSTVFAHCHQILQSTMDLCFSEMENIKSELACIECTQTADYSKCVISSKDVFESGIENRKSDIEILKNAIEVLKSETEILSVVESCIQHFQVFVRNREEEIISVKKQLGVLENEVTTLLLVNAPALKIMLKINEKGLEILMPIVEKLYKISNELKSEDEKGIEACQSMYCSMLETLKIEREAIKYDIDSLQQVELEKKDIIDTKGKEIIVSFKDLYLAAFDLKKSDLEKVIRKKDIEVDIKMKKSEIIKSFQKQGIEEKELGKGILLEETYDQFVQYYDIKKEKRKSAIEEKIMKEFGTIEKTLTFESQEGSDMSEYSKDYREEIPDSKKTFEHGYVLIYEARMRDVEADINYQREKIAGVITMRKLLMENIVLAKKKELEETISVKEKEMRTFIHSIKGKQSFVTCNLKELFDEIPHLKNNESASPLTECDDVKFIADKFQVFYVSVKLEKFFDIALEIKEAELQMMLLSRHKDVDKIVGLMKKELENVITTSKEQLEESIKQYRKSEKAKAMEYALYVNSSQKDHYVINEEEIFPDITSFKEYVNSFKGFFITHDKKVCDYKDTTFRSEEILRNNTSHIPLFRRHLPFVDYVPNHILNVLEVEINYLRKIVTEMNLDKAKAILHGQSFISAESAVHDVSKRLEKGIFLDIVSILNDNTSMLVLGSFIDKNCDVFFNLDKDCRLVYFEKAENIRKWCPVLEKAKEVAININLKHFCRNDCLDEISTMFDWAVTTLPIGPSRFERFIGDVGLLEQIKFAFLELHHNHLLCRSCTFVSGTEDFGLSFDHISKLLNLKHVSEPTELLPLSSGIPSVDDVEVASYVCKVILMRGALLNAICLSNVFQRIEKKQITVITTSFFIQESTVYQKMLKIFLSYLSPGKEANFIFDKKSNCGVGASIMASVASHVNRETPGLYLSVLDQHLKKRNKLFSIQNFWKLLSDPNLSPEAVQLSHRYMEEMKFDLPMAVVWAYNFINGNIHEAENLYKLYSISLSHVTHLVCRKISCAKNLDLAKQYIQFLKKFGAEQNVKESAYKVLLDLLFYKGMYQEAVALIEECMESKIPLTKLRHSTLIALYDFYMQKSKEEQLPPFLLPNMEFHISDSDSDMEEK